jgi:hypothetical protein
MADKSERFRWLVRLGYAARGLVYILIGYLALSAPGGGGSGPQGAFSWLQDVPLGRPILYLASLGLLAYAIYRFCSLLFDVENHGTDGSGIAHRVGHAASGVAHLVLAYTAFQFAQRDPQAASGGGAEAAAGTVLSVSYGSLVLGLIGLGFLAAGFMQAKSAATGSFMHGISRKAPPFIEYAGRAGYAARAIVFGIIAWSLVQSAWFVSTAQVKTLGEAVGSLADNRTLYMAVGIGLLLFGIFSLFMARYQVIPRVDPQRFKSQFR